MSTDDRQTAELPDLGEAEREALHEAELGLEWLRRAHGALLEFHHGTGHAMDHLARAESLFREAGRTELADALRDEHLPRGVIDGGRWSYDVVETFEEGLMEPLTGFERAAREQVADGQRHVTERRQERRWKRRARD